MDKTLQAGEDTIIESVTVLGWQEGNSWVDWAVVSLLLLLQVAG